MSFSDRPLTTFFVAAIVLGWLAAAPLALGATGLGLIPITVPEEWLMLVAFTPTLAALGTQWLLARNLRIAQLGPWPRALAVALLAWGLAVLAFAVAPALVLTGGAASSLHWPAILAASAAWWGNPFNLLGGPLNEEFGWRGFALPRLQARYGPLRGSLFLAAGWFVWHVPLFAVSGWLTVPLWAFGVLLLCLTILMTWVVNLARGSVVPSVVAHAVFNSSFPMLVGLCRGLPTREPGLPWYVAGVALATAVVSVATRGRMSYAPHEVST